MIDEREGNGHHSKRVIEKESRRIGKRPCRTRKFGKN
jgi:hypothetical protein